MVGEFHYRLPGTPLGSRPGAHSSRAEGASGLYLGLRPLIAHADPRRIDLRRSVTDPFGQWLVRTMSERVAVPMYVVADLSASMAFGAAKQAALADLVDSAAQSAWHVGDPFGFVAAAVHVHNGLTLPAMVSRAQGLRIANALRALPLEGPNADGLLNAARYLGRRRSLVLLVSDFHFELDFARRVLASLAGHYVVPVIVWDRTETTAPGGGWIEVADSESRRSRVLWLRPDLRERIEAVAAARRKALAALFRGLGSRPLFLEGQFDPERMTRHFLGGADAQ